jgi:hypothetical protein
VSLNIEHRTPPKLSNTVVFFQHLYPSLHMHFFRGTYKLNPSSCTLLTTLP